ncbi:uncharacterized protein LOC113212625 [Frankliniella occidentalis]|uniref:Uncharacterized protein LOC113212625 n=1 Tax=Frankliniella occidentalis TaxID=133901 RepID=A0A9C6XDQ8_FRAOC|nr:uncharacterized protein LOC113212625 [Frankliniella occidentalis]
MAIVELFDWWRLLINPEKAEWRKKIESLLLGTKPFSCFLMIFLPTTFMGGLQKGLTMKAIMALRLPISLMPCFAAGCLFGFNRKALTSLFEDAVRISSQICTDGVPPRIEENSRRLLNFTRIGYGAMHAWTAIATLSVPVSVAFQGKLLIDMWPWFDGDVGVWLGGTLQTVIVYPMAFPVYAFSVYMWSVVEALAVLFNIISNQLTHASTYSQVHQVVRMHAQVLSLSARVAQQIEVVLTVLTIGILMTPALSMLMVIRGFFDLFSAASIPFLVAFWILCRAGQILESAALHLMSSSMVTFSNVQEVNDANEKSKTCRLLLVIMMQAMRKQSITAFRGNMRYNLHTCLEAFRSWYSILQYLLNMPDNNSV